MVVFSAGRLQRHQGRMLSKLLARPVGAEVEMKEDHSVKKRKNSS